MFQKLHRFIHSINIDQICAKGLEYSKEQEDKIPYEREKGPKQVTQYKNEGESNKVIWQKLWKQDWE